MSDVKALLETSFDDEVKSIFQEKPVLKNFLLNHERKNLCIENMLKAVKESEYAWASKITRQDIIYIGREYAKTFCKLSLKHAEEQSMTSLQKDVQERKHNEAKEIEEMFFSEDEVTEL